MTFGLFTYMAPRGSLEHIYICVPSNRSEDHHQVLDHPVLLNFPSGGTCFPTTQTPYGLSLSLSLSLSHTHTQTHTHIMAFITKEKKHHSD